ncbi:tubulin polyglutamylase TTLL13 isoform X1 [Cyrtonyx montezumae]|uniref:tubulin polyglutamylase TTLL13 isoform X1 n=1 Tax=Cyrtonyx montezumae TaxID=9017 RepID=UPI0032DAA79D
MEMKRFQKINHFPGMIEICRKDLLARNLNRMFRLFPKEYNIFPRTWSLPADYGDFQAYRRRRKNRTFICKPDSGSQGRGIFITRNGEEIKHGERMICQQYISKGDICMHLTNYAINKRNANFVQDDTMGSKRKLSTLNAWMMDNSYNTTKLWEDIEDIIIKTLISAHPVVKHNYQSCFPNHTTTCACFEILGFDILLDRNLKPWLLEVNHSPSFSTDSDLDREVKDALLFDTINLINVHACNKRKVMEEDKQRAKERLLQAHWTPHVSRHEELESSQAAWLSEAEDYENSHRGSYRRIYPAHGTDKYEPFFKQSSSLFKETASSRAREECIRQQLEEIRTKREKLEAVTRKKKKERKEGLQRESASDKSTIHNKTPASATHFTYRSTKRWDKKVQHVQYDSMQPQDILENEEKKRVSALARRKNLIRGLGIIDQLCQLLPTAERSSDTHGPCSDTSKIQTPFLFGSQARQPTPFMSIVPLSFSRDMVWPSGQLSAHEHSTRAQLLDCRRPAPSTLLVRGQSIPCREQHTVQCSSQPRDWGCPWSRAAEPAAVTQPCAKTTGRLTSTWQPSAGGIRERGCECTLFHFGSAFCALRAVPGQTWQLWMCWGGRGGGLGGAAPRPGAPRPSTPRTAGCHCAGAHAGVCAPAGDIGRPLCAGSVHPASLRCLVRAGKAMSDGSFRGITAQELLVASAALVLHTRATHCTSAVNFCDVRSTERGGGGGRRGCGGSWGWSAAPRSGR